MKILLKSAILACLLLTACTDKKAQNANENGASATEVKEIEAIESLTNEMEETTIEIEKTAEELDALLDEIDN